MMKFYFVNGSIVVGSVSVFIGSTIQIDNPDHHLNQSSVTCQPDLSSGLSSFIWIVISGCWSAIIGSAIISLRIVVVGCNILNAWFPYFQKYSTYRVIHQHSYQYYNFNNVNDYINVKLSTKSKLLTLSTMWKIDCVSTISPYFLLINHLEGIYLWTLTMKFNVALNLGWIIHKLGSIWQIVPHLCL